MAHRSPATSTPQPDDRALRWIADAYEQAQRIRLQTGERLRAVLQGRDETWAAVDLPAADASAVLKSIRSGETDGPVPLLARTYRRYWQEEQELSAAMRDALGQHPVWPWLSEIKGIGPTLAGKLLARLDPQKASTPSGFWAYCGLATVPGVEYRCSECGLRSTFPVRYRVSGSHNRLGSSRSCSGRLERRRGPEDGIRVAQPKPARGERAGYDRTAKKVCYLIATSFLRAGGPYAQLYRDERGKLDTCRPGWAAGRKHLAALRKAEKQFLLDLWIAWRGVLELPVTQAFAERQERQREETSATGAGTTAETRDESPAADSGQEGASSCATSRPESGVASATADR